MTRMEVDVGGPRARANLRAVSIVLSVEPSETRRISQPVDVSGADVVACPLEDALLPFIILVAFPFCRRFAAFAGLYSCSR